MQKFLLDTNICIYLIKKRPEEVPDRFRQHSPKDVAISIITLFELEYGIEKSNHAKRSKKALSKFLSPLTLIGLDRDAVSEAASMRARLEKKGMPIGPYDILIAGIAKSRNMTLVTNNTRELERIDNLKLDNWINPDHI